MLCFLIALFYACGLNLQIELFVFKQSVRFSLVNICFSISLNPLNFDLNTSLNHLTRVSTVNLSSIENSSDKGVDFCFTKTFVAASFNWLNVTDSKYCTCPCEK